MDNNGLAEFSQPLQALNEELPDEQLDAVSGGINRRPQPKTPQPCLGNCGRTTTDNSGYCEECYARLYKNGWRPVL